MSGIVTPDDYENALIEIDIDYVNASVALSEAVVAKPIIFNSFNMLSEHDFSVYINIMDKIGDLSVEISSNAFAMGLQFEALKTALNNLDDFILNRLSELDSSKLSNEEKEALRNLYNEYKNGNKSYEEFLDEVAKIKDANTISEMFGIPIETFMKFVGTGAKEFSGKSLEEIIENALVYELVSTWGINITIDNITGSMNAALSSAIAATLINRAKNISLNSVNEEIVIKNLGELNRSAFGSFCLTALITSITNICYHTLKDELDAEQLFRDLGEGLSVAGSGVLGTMAGESIASGILALLGGKMAVSTMAELAITSGLTAAIIAAIYVGCSQIVDYLADNLWSDENTNYSHDELIEMLRENGAMIIESIKLQELDENIYDTYIRVRKEGIPDSLANFFLGSAGLPYNSKYDDSIEFQAILALFGNISKSPNDFDEADIEEWTRGMSEEERQRFVDTITEIQNYYKNNPSSGADLNDFLSEATRKYINNGGTFYNVE